MEEEKLSVYNLEYVPHIFTLQNNSVLCYLNSLVQSLMSCSSFNEYLLNNKKTYESNNIVNEYIRIYNNNSQKDTKITKIENAANILEMLNKIRASKNKTILSPNIQQDIHEGLLLLLDSIGNGVERLFHNRYKCEIRCLKCKSISFPGDNNDYEEPPELVINLSEYNFTEASKEEMEKRIMRNIQIPRDYKCNSCSVVNTYDEIRKRIEPNVTQIYNLARLSEIIVVLFKKYSSKKNIYFPENLDFNSINGKLKYKLVSQVEHIGNMYGGHYKAKCSREKPYNFHENRIIKAKKILSNLTEGIDRLNINKYEENITKINKVIKNDEDRISIPDGVFLFDDNEVKYISSGFTPDQNTYVLFYHLYN